MSLCACGCGKTTKLVDRNDANAGLVRGTYRRFVLGHNNPTVRRKQFDRHANSSVLCQCGCGQFTTLTRTTETKRGMRKGVPNRFIVGHNARNGSPAKNAYVSHRGKLDHVAVAERALGRPLPPGSEVHHVDGNRRNNNNSNLVICQSRAYHMMLHARARVVKAGGDPNTERVCSKCRQIKPLTAFYQNRKNKTNGRMTLCIPCQREATDLWKSRKRSAA